MGERVVGYAAEEWRRMTVLGFCQLAQGIGLVCSMRKGWPCVWG